MGIFEYTFGECFASRSVLGNHWRGLGYNRSTKHVIVLVYDTNLWLVFKKRKGYMNALRRMRQAIHAQDYRISSHANDEMADDFLMAADVENIILTGTIMREFTH